MKRPIIDEDYSKQKIRIRRRLAAQRSIERKKMLLKNKDKLDSTINLVSNGNISTVRDDRKIDHLNDEFFAACIFL